MLEKALPTANRGPGYMLGAQDAGVPEHINRGAIDRRTARFAAIVMPGLLSALLFTIAGLVYVASLPREVPVILNQLADGTYMPRSDNATPDEIGKRMMLTHWLGYFREGSSDPNSLAARGTAALLDDRYSADVTKQVAAYNQEVADAHAVVTPRIYSAVSSKASPYEYELRWDESRLEGAKTTVRSMLANVSVAFDTGQATFNTDVLANPFGMYIHSLHVIDLGVKK